MPEEKMTYRQLLNEKVEAEKVITKVVQDLEEKWGCKVRGIDPEKQHPTGRFPKTNYVRLTIEI